MKTEAARNGYGIDVVRGGNLLPEEKNDPIK